MRSKYLTKVSITNNGEKYGMSLSLEMKLDAKSILTKVYIHWPYTRL